MSKIHWEMSTTQRSGDWHKGYVGEMSFFHISPWTKDSRPGWELVCTLPEHRAEDLYPYDSVENAQGYSEEILKDFLKKSGLQPKPARRAKVVPPAIRRVVEFLEARKVVQDSLRGGLDPETIYAVGTSDGIAELKLADLEALVKLAKKGAS